MTCIPCARELPYNDSRMNRLLRRFPESTQGLFAGSLGASHVRHFATSQRHPCKLTAMCLTETGHNSC